LNFRELFPERGKFEMWLSAGGVKMALYEINTLPVVSIRDMYHPASKLQNKARGKILCSYLLFTKFFSPQ
jgi:hypothetical protein